MDEELKNIIVSQNIELIKGNLKVLLCIVDNLKAVSNDIYERNKSLNIKLKN